MKVLIVHDYGVLVGGAEHMSIALRDGLRRRGHDARFFASTAAPLPLPNVADHTCLGTMSFARRFLQVANPFAMAKLKQVLSDFRPDVVHVRMFMTQLSPLVLRLLRDTPCLLHVVNYDLICPLNTRVLPDGSACTFHPGTACYRNGCLGALGTMRTIVQQRLWDKHKSMFDLIVTNSHWVRRKLTEQDVRVDETVWNGVPVTAHRPPLGEVPTAAFVGRLVPKKGVHVLIDAMARVVGRIPNARLSIIGDGPQRTELEEQTKSLNLREHVTICGHLPREAMERQVANAWTQVVPSVWDEPFGLVAAEAMMRGTAAIVSAAGGLAEQVVEGQTGFCVPPNDRAALVEALVKLLEDRIRAEAMGASARAHALANFTEDQVVERFLALYDRIIATKAPTAHVDTTAAVTMRSS